MDDITILRGQTPEGPLTRREVAERILAGSLTLDTLAFRPGMNEWRPLLEVLRHHDQAMINAKNAGLKVGIVPKAYSYSASMAPPSELVYATFWQRVGAYLIDGVVICSVSFILFLPVLILLNYSDKISKAESSSSPENAPIYLLIILLSLVTVVIAVVGQWLYHAFLESGSYQATFGKRCLNLKVIRVDGGRLSFWHATGRFFAHMVTRLIPLGIGYLMVAFTPRKQALHDLIASTLVVQKQS